MIADTTFASALLKEQRLGKPGPAHRRLGAVRAQNLRLTIITAGEIGVIFDSWPEAWAWLSRWTMYRLHSGVARAATELDRALIAEGARLGENDTWIAGFALYYREPLLTADDGFARAVPHGLRLADR
ncbi:MAG TPA: type II toxin-antitoxin system VapC family toxin [Verrucomicrobiota bacterium]|nr:type II toxin-antitoxin system VapC family toxin [Verrucomicrobiota bacterium]